MKTHYLLTLTLFISLASFAQKKKANNMHEKIKSLKIAFITERLDLTEKEAQQFWPIYYDFDKKRNKLRKESRKEKTDIDHLTEKEATKILSEIKKIEFQKYKIYNDFISHLEKNLTARKILKLKQTEDEFKRKMINQFKKHHKPRTP